MFNLVLSRLRDISHASRMFEPSSWFARPKLSLVSLTLVLIFVEVLALSCRGDDSKTTSATRSPSSPIAIATRALSPALGTAAPPGYGQSCASTHPWGVQVNAPFACIDEPKPGFSTPRGSQLAVRGYAGGSFENNVVVELRLLAADGSVGPGMPGAYVVDLHGT